MAEARAAADRTSKAREAASVAAVVLALAAAVFLGGRRAAPRPVTALHAAAAGTRVGAR